MPLTLPIPRPLSFCANENRRIAGNQASITARVPAGQPAFAVNSTDLLRGQKAVEISHNGSTYRLQATRLGKLILTK